MRHTILSLVFAIMLITCLFLLEQIISVHACCWSHNRFSFCKYHRYQPVYFFLLDLFVSYFGVLFIISGTVHAPMSLHKGTYLFLLLIISLLTCQGPFGFLQNYLVLAIVSGNDLIMDAVAHGGSVVYSLAVEHNQNKMTFFGGFALGFFINLN